jgi:hypothetical protein
MAPPKSNLHCGAPITATTHPPLSPHRSTSAHPTPRTQRWQCESRSDVGFSMCRSTWSRALGRGTYGGCVVGEDGQGLLRTLHRQVRRLLARRAASPSQTLRAGSITPLHTDARCTQHDGGTPCSVSAALRVARRCVHSWDPSECGKRVRQSRGAESLCGGVTAWATRTPPVRTRRVQGGCRSAVAWRSFCGRGGTHTAVTVGMEGAPHATE